MHRAVAMFPSEIETRHRDPGQAPVAMQAESPLQMLISRMMRWGPAAGAGVLESMVVLAVRDWNSQVLRTVMSDYMYVTAV